jgi:phosphoribosylformylglycinamidine (FGAM) synthase-like enzyme
MVQTNTVQLPGADAAVLRLKGRKDGIAVCMDGNGRYCHLDPYVGAQIALAEAARNVVCVGAEPAGITNGLNFGNPDKPDRYWQFARCVEGLAEACRALEVPVVSGNVSFYNEAPDAAIFPTPIIGMVGVLEDVENRCSPGFQREGDAIVLLGATKPELGGSEYLKVMHGLEVGRPPAIDLEAEKRAQALCLKAIRSGWVRSAHDCSDGGLAAALAECCIFGGAGAQVSLPDGSGLGAREWLFAESQSRIVLSAAQSRVGAIRQEAERLGVPFVEIGRVGGDSLLISAGGRNMDVSVAELYAAYEGTLKCVME